MNEKKALLTGAAGFIGSHTAERLIRDGYQVLGFDNFDPFYPRKFKEQTLQSLLNLPGFEFVEADLCDAGAVSRAVSQFQPNVVIHLAAKAGVRPSIQDPAAYVETNVTGTLNLLEATKSLGLNRFVFASSSSVYGNASKVPFQEDDATSSPESPYAATKKAGELLCYTYHQLSKMPIVCLRFFTVFGPRQRPDLAIHKFVRLIEEGKSIPFFGDGSTSRDYTFVQDTVNGIVASIDAPEPWRIYNLGRSNPVTLNEMVQTIERAVGKPAILDRKPDQPGDVTTTYADVSRAEAELGYRPQVEFDEGVRRFVEWFRANKAAWS